METKTTSNNKVPIFSLVSLYAYLLGSQTLIIVNTMGAILSYIEIVFSEKYYNDLMFISCFPPIIIFLFVPVLSYNLGFKNSFYYNIVVNSLCCALICCGFLIGSSNTLAASIAIYIGIYILQFANILNENNLMTMSDTIDPRVNMMFLAGGASSNLFVALYLFVVRRFNLDNVQHSLIIIFAVPVGLNGIYCWVFSSFLRSYAIVYQSKPKEDKKSNANQNDNEEPNNWLGFFVLWEKKTPLLLLSILFFQVYVVFPNFLFKMDGTPTHLFIYSVSEVFGRILLSAVPDSVREGIDKKKAAILVLVHLFFCCLAVICYLIFKGYIREYIPIEYIPKMNFFTYICIAFLHGLAGSCMCLLIYRGLENTQTKNYAGMLYTIAIVFFMMGGSAISSYFGSIMKILHVGKSQ